jgi:hypothetical protein
MRAAHRGDVAGVATALATQSIDVNLRLSAATRHKDVTAVYLAAENGHVTVINKLWRNLADLDQPASDGSTPLWIAARNGRVAAVGELVRRATTLMPLVVTNRTAFKLEPHSRSGLDPSSIRQHGSPCAVFVASQLSACHPFPLNADNLGISLHPDVSTDTRNINASDSHGIVHAQSYRSMPHCCSLMCCV